MSLFLGGGLEVCFEGGWDLEGPREGTQTLVFEGPCASTYRPSWATPGGNCSSPGPPGLDLML